MLKFPTIRFEEKPECEHIYLEGLERSDRKNMGVFEYGLVANLVMVCYNAAPPHDPGKPHHTMSSPWGAEEFIHHPRGEKWFWKLLRIIRRESQPKVLLAEVKGMFHSGNRHCFLKVYRAEPGHLVVYDCPGLLLLVPDIEKAFRARVLERRF